ncbi:hypothetical protein SAMN05421858_4426 [Haladaptatus litoreus]|uniref:DUF7344 domain-containing protein n=1 Tax=Haladaptatus litoreus TaxID=553468 RepID=A0A1N7EN80_9EURY|nr:hypothetical protein [Haladaptatus litoreus]SIR89537.1 hypothetical protein SAMN05421858_4426 [Haladaptatus litoreus]
MGKRNQTQRRKSEDPVYRAIGNDQRRVILSLLSQTPQISEQALARRLTTTEQTAPDESLPPDEVRNSRIDLYHHHLPILEDTDFIRWKSDEDLITTTDHIALEDPRFQRLLQTEVKGIDDVLAELTETRQRLVLAILRDENSSMSQTALAREVVKWESDEADPAQAAVDETAIALHHNQLPTLSDASIIDYDTETGQATYANHPAVEEIVRILQKPDSRLVKRLNGFLEGLQTSYEQATESTSDPLGTPSIWRAPYE